MLNKLIKYDLKWIYKVVAVFYCLALVFSVITRCFGCVENSALFYVLEKIAAGFAVSMVASALINCIMRSWARFVTNIYKDESYLTHTLPVSKNTIYFSKVLSSVICTFTTVVVGAVCLYICYYSEENMQALKSSLELAASTFDTTVLNLLLCVCAVLLVEVIFILLVGYAGIIIGHRSDKHRMAKSIVYAFLMYGAANMISVFAVVTAGFVNDDIMNIIKTTQATGVNIDVIKILLAMAIVLYLVYNIAVYFVGSRQFNKGVNVD